MTTAVDVAQYIESKHAPFGEMQLQKLVFYVQAWSLAWDGKPMFEEPVEAWSQGPVLRSLRHWLTWRTRIAPEQSPLSESERDTVDAVLEFYGKWSGGDLGDRTHAERPWREVWDARVPAGATRCSDEIPRSSMRRFYTEQASQRGS